MIADVWAHGRDPHRAWLVDVASQPREGDPSFAQLAPAPNLPKITKAHSFAAENARARLRGPSLYVCRRQRLCSGPEVPAG